MSLGTWNCDSSASSISRRGLLCGGGAGFVTALSAPWPAVLGLHSAALASMPPEVDSLAVRIVTDNQIVSSFRREAGWADHRTKARRHLREEARRVSS